MTDHEYPLHLLEAFIAGQLSAEENDRILSHLPECDRCLADVDLLWTQQLDDEPRSQIPELESEIAERVEGMILDRIRRTDLVGQIVKLGTLGLFMSWQALVRPLVRK